MTLFVLIINQCHVIMITAQYFANVVADVAITMSDIKKTSWDPQLVLSFAVFGSIEFQTTFTI